MLNIVRITAFFLMLVLIFSCNQNPKAKEVKDTTKPTVAKEVKNVSDSTTLSAVNPYLDDLVSFIAGVDKGKTACLSKLDSGTKWKHYASEMDSLFSHINNVRTSKMKVWADSELINNHTTTTVFYPFSGPDFLNADIFYPEADQYIMIAMEPVGSLPDICNMSPVKIRDYLSSVNNSLKDIVKRSYFITMKMSGDLFKTKVNGTVPLISLFIKRTGHHLVSMQRIGVDTTGKCQFIDSLNTVKTIASGIKINFLSLSGKKVQSVYYLRADISDKGFKKNPGFLKYLDQLPQSHSYLKAASYLMHSENFKQIRNIIFDKSLTILQDDSGIAYRFFDKKKWDIRLYGKYNKPKDEFSYIKEPDLEKAYKTLSIKPLPYSIGYNWRTGNSNLLFAVKKIN